jgi:predicted aspartyl protease
LDASLAADKAWLDAFDAFEKRGDDRVLALAVNRLLAELRRAERDGRGQPALLARIRGIRRELGVRAMAVHARQENGTVIVETAVIDEPCWYLLDTGAATTTISGELVDALGLAGSLGDETTMVVADGRRVRGRTLTLPSFTAARMSERDVKAALLPVTEVGVDGLLGQSFLKRFVYTVDERRPEKLVLMRR